MRVKHRLFASALALSLAAGLPAVSSLPLFATEATTTTVTIKNPVEGTTYKAYQVFTGTYDSANEATLGSIDWGSGVNGTDIISALKGSWELGESATAEDVAKKLSESPAKAVEFRGVAEKNLVSEHYDTVQKEGKLEFSDLPTGYYLVTETTGTGENAVTMSFMMQVVGGGTLEIVPKNSSVPNSEKHVHENTGTNGMLTAGEVGYQDVADYNVGDEIPFVLKAGNLPTPDSIKDWKEYSVVFEDTMSQGLSLVENSIKVYAASSEEEGKKLTWTVDDELSTEGDDKKAVITAPEDECSFHVEVPVKNAGENAVDYSGKVLVVTFKAKLNANAKHGVSTEYDDTNHNEFVLAYTNNPNTGEKKTTDKDYTLVFTYDMDIDKVDGENPDKKLNGAEFVLYRGTGENIEYYTIDETTEAVSFVKDKKDAKVFVSNGTTLPKITGLDQGTYYLEETKAPDGYNILSEPVEITLTASKEETASVSTTNIGSVHKGLTIKVGAAEGVPSDAGKNPVIVVENNKGSKLPSTGGMGTTILYTVGGILTVGAAAFLLTGKRLKKEEE